MPFKILYWTTGAGDVWSTSINCSLFLIANKDCIFFSITYFEDHSINDLCASFQPTISIWNIYGYNLLRYLLFKLFPSVCSKLQIICSGPMIINTTVC
jgi:hypothetical protein